MKNCFKDWSQSTLSGDSEALCLKLADNGLDQNNIVIVWVWISALPLFLPKISMRVYAIDKAWTKKLLYCERNFHNQLAGVLQWFTLKLICSCMFENVAVITRKTITCVTCYKRRCWKVLISNNRWRIIMKCFLFAMRYTLKRLWNESLNALRFTNKLFNQQAFVNTCHLLSLVFYENQYLSAGKEKS